MIMKVGLEKAYNQLEWGFIHEISINAGVPRQMVDIIYTCVSTGSFRLLSNGQLTYTLKPMRGVWQVDLLSPFLFVLCLE